MMLMAGPWGTLPAGSTASTTEFDNDIDGRPPWEVLPVGLAVAATEF
jgi:hypothetical protein